MGKPAELPYIRKGLIEFSPKRSMRDLIRENKTFLSLFLIWIAAGGIFLLTTQKGMEILWINNHHSSFGDWFFKNIYDYFDFNCAPPLFIAVLLFAVFWSYGKTIQVIINAVIVLKGVDLLHKYVFTSELNSRPTVFFGLQRLHTLEGVSLNGHSGYPAASVAETFALLLLLTIYIAEKRWSFLFFGIALFYAISRLYVFQNFFDAVYFGSITGVGATLCMYPLLNSKYYQSITWKDRSVFGDVKRFFSSRAS